MTIYKYDDAIQRAIGDTTPIILEWPTAGATITAQVAFDNQNFSDCVGTVSEITVGDTPRYQLSYASADRKTTVGIITYKFTDGTDTGYLELHITPEIPDAVASVSSEADLTTLIASLGPKRVKTKDMEIEAHNPLMMQKLAERRASKPVALSQFGFQIAKRRCRTRCDRSDDCC